MSLAAGRSAAISAVVALMNQPASSTRTPEAAAAILVDAIIDLIKNVDINAAPPAGSLTNGGGPVLGAILGSLGGVQ